MAICKMMNLIRYPDCIALSENGKCTRLNVYSCQGEKCPFKRTSKEDHDSVKYAYQRLSRLDVITQDQIAQKYFSGSMPWKEKQSV